MELIAILQEAANGKLPKIPINRDARLKDDKTGEEKKLSNGKVVSALWPLSLAPNELTPPKQSPVIA